MEIFQKIVVKIKNSVCGLKYDIAHRVYTQSILYILNILSELRYLYGYIIILLIRHF